MVANAQAFLTFGGGVNEQDDINVSADECIKGQNFLLDRSARSFQPREPWDLKGTAPNGLENLGIMQLVKNDGTFTTLQQSAGVVYTVSSSFVYAALAATTPAVDVASKLRGTRWALDDVMIVSDLEKKSTLKRWNGTTFDTLPHVTTGVTDLFTSYTKEFQNRVWHFNIKTDTTDLAHVILVSEFENYLGYDRAAVARGGDPGVTITNGDQAFWLVSPDLKPINGVVTFFDTIIISTEGGRLFKLVGTDSTDYRFVEYYTGSSALGPEGVVNIGNDVMYVRKGPAVEILSATDEFGDVSADDASRWIPKLVDNLKEPVISVYDQKNQDVLFFTNGRILVFDKDIHLQKEFSPWMNWTTQMTEGLNPKTALAMKDPGTGVDTVYFGGPGGQLYNLHGTSAMGDKNTHPIVSNRKTRLISEIDTIKNILVGRVLYRRKGAMTLNMTIEWSENYVDTNASIALKAPIVNAGTLFYGSTLAPVYYNDVVHYNAGGVTEDRLSTTGFSPAGKSTSFFMTLSANTGVQYLINRIEV